MIGKTKVKKITTESGTLILSPSPAISLEQISRQLSVLIKMLAIHLQYLGVDEKTRESFLKEAEVQDLCQPWLPK